MAVFVHLRPNTDSHHYPTVVQEALPITQTPLCELQIDTGVCFHSVHRVLQYTWAWRACWYCGDYPNAGIAETVVCDCNRLLLKIRL